MVAEAVILDGDEGIGNISGQILDPHHRALHHAAPRHQPVVIVQDGDVARIGRGQKIAHVGQVGDEMRPGDGAEDAAPHQEHGE